MYCIVFTITASMDECSNIISTFICLSFCMLEFLLHSFICVTPTFIYIYCIIHTVLYSKQLLLKHHCETL